MSRVILQDKNYRKLLLSRTISSFGNGMSPTAVAFAVLALPHADARSLSIVLTAQAIPLVLLLPIGGVIADRMGRARMIGSTDVLLSLFVFFNAWLFATGNATVGILVVTQAIAGVLNALWYPAYPGLPADMVDEEHLQSANSYISFGGNIAMIFGAAAGGALVANIGSAAAIAIDATTFLVAGILVWTMRHTSSRSESTTSIITELKDGWTIFISYRWVVVVVVAFSFMVLAFAGAEGVLGPLIAKQHFDGPTTWSTIVAAEGFGLLLGAVIGTKWKPRHPIFTGMVITFPAAVLMLTLAFLAPLPVIMLAAMSWGIGMELFMIWWFTALQANIPREAIGRVSAYDAFGSLLFRPMGLALAGALAVAIGTKAALIAGATLTVIAIVAALLSPSVRHIEVPADAE